MSQSQKIIAFSGRKQSGKNTAANWMVGIEMMGLGIVRNAFMITEEGKLYITDLFGDTEYEGELDLSRNNPESVLFRAEHIDPYVKIYSFADLLKKEVCMKILGLTYEQCYGSDEDKNTLTHLRWENMPGVVTTSWVESFENFETSGGWPFTKEDLTPLIVHAPGPMTAREVLQFVGTEIFRKMYGNVWVDALIRQIKEENSLLAIICDVRFPNEVEGLQAAGGKVVRLTRNPAGDSDAHASETALDKDRFDWSKFDAIIDNAEMGINQQNESTHELLVSWGWMPEIKKEV